MGSRAGLDIRSREAIRHLSAHFRGHGALIQVAILNDQKCSYDIPCKKRCIRKDLEKDRARQGGNIVESALVSRVEGAE